jgi:hypothetical protein
VTEAEARDLLRDWPGVGGVEAWIARRRWHVTPDGWTVDGMLQGWRFRVEVVASGLRLSARATDDQAPAVWVVTAKRTAK